MADNNNPTAAALQLTTPQTLSRFLKTLPSHITDAQTIHVYEHRNNVYSLHGHTHTTLAIRLLPTLRPTDLPPVSPSTTPTPTLHFDIRIARDLISALLYTAGRKIRVWGVASDGRIVSRAQGSPGNLDGLEEFLGDTRLDEAVVLGVRLLNERSLRLVGVCAWDVGGRSLSVGEVYDDESFSALEGVIVATNAKEVVFCEADAGPFEMAKMNDVIERCGIAMTTMKKRSFDAKDVPHNLELLTGDKLSLTQFLDLKAGLSATAAVLDYVRIMSDASIEGRVSVIELTTSSYMQLDSAAMRALNILPFPGDGGKKGSLYGLMNRTKCAMGGRLLRKWLSQPLQDEVEINERLDVVDAFVGADSCRVAVRDTHVNKMPDIDLLCRRFTKDGGSKAGLQDVVRLYQCSVRLPFLCEEMERDSVEKVVAERYAVPLRKFVAELANFEALVETTIDLDQIDNGEFVVNPAVDPELQQLREKQDAVVADIEAEYQDVSSSISGLKGDGLKLERKDNLGYIFRLTRKEEKLIRGKKQFTVLETRKDGVRFQSRGLRRLSEGYKEIAEEYQLKESEMRKKTLDVAGTYVEVFLDVSNLLAEVDVLCCFADVASSSLSGYVRPKLKPSGSGIVLKQARHPIVEENMIDGTTFISNDIDLTPSIEGEEANEGGSLLLVTGPNMGGKSTYIRSAGVLTLMAHVGCFVPAAEAEIPITDRIFARVGAGDNQHRAISTFMSEMLETAAILKSATAKSLVIIDELGRGTGTTDGYGLAYAISKHIVTKMKSACLFATHFFELTALADDVCGVRNVHVSAETDPRSNKLTFLYEVVSGACDQSFGVHVAEMAHFPASVVEAAKRKAVELEGCGRGVGKKRKLDGVSDAEREEGERLMREFMEGVRKMPRGSEEELKESVTKARDMRRRVLAEKNAYVSSLIAGS